jgi:hypothetical protein
MCPIVPNVFKKTLTLAKKSLFHNCPEEKNNGFLGC